MMKLLAAVLAMGFLQGCASVVNIPEPEAPVLVQNLNTEFHTIAAPATGKLVAAVYGFTDKTGQRKPSERRSDKTVSRFGRRRFSQKSAYGLI